MKQVIDRLLPFESAITTVVEEIGANEDLDGVARLTLVGAWITTSKGREETRDTHFWDGPSTPQRWRSSSTPTRH